MALYIHPENQQLLWKIANKNPMVQEYFAAYPPNIQESWFKQVISSFYEQNRNNVSTSEDLYEINKNTLTYMVNDVKRNVQYVQEQKQMRSVTPESQQSFPQTYSVTENKEDRFNSQYNQYQQNYQTIFDKKTPETIDFREKIEDTPISGNMEDLVQKHLRERDEELKRYAPAPFFGQGLKINHGQSTNLADELIKREPDRNEGLNMLPPQPNSPNLPNRLTIDPTPNNVQISIDELSQDNLPNLPKWENHNINNERPSHENKQGTTLKWLDNENSTKIQSLEQEITMLKNQVLQMSDKISFLINVNKDIFDFSAQRLRMSNITISGGFLFDPSGLHS